MSAVSSEITRKAKSNLAFALGVLPKERRHDMVVFYAFCRVIDDLADEDTMPANQRATALADWKRGLEEGFTSPTDFQQEVLALRAKHDLPTELLTAVIDGCLMDLHPQRFQTWEDLSQYTWKVACAVGLVSVRLFGCKDPRADRFAIALGHALQLTNILRDVGEDLDKDGRVYLPLGELARFQYTEEDLHARIHDARFTSMMEFQANRAEEFYREASDIHDVLPVSDRVALVPAAIMESTYHTLLGKMERDHFRVFDRRYRLSKARKFAIFSKHLITRPAVSGE